MIDKLITRNARFERTLEALDGFFALLSAFSEEASLEPGLANELAVVLEELFVNATRHSVGLRGDIEIRLERDGDQFQACLIDENVEPFDVTTATLDDLSSSIENRRTGGMGLHIVRHFADELTYTHENGNGIITLRKKLGKSDVCN